jgi:hypothetical protein
MDFDLNGHIHRVKNSRDGITVETTYRLDDHHPDLRPRYRRTVCPVQKLQRSSQGEKMVPGIDEFDASGDEPEPSISDCLSNLDLVDVKVTAINVAQIEMPNAWDAMLQWYEVSAVDPPAAQATPRQTS